MAGHNSPPPRGLLKAVWRWWTSLLTESQCSCKQGEVSPKLDAALSHYLSQNHALGIGFEMCEGRIANALVMKMNSALAMAGC
jgi:hypothetical protein